MRIVAVLPMRAGSQRVPKKNIRELGGKPLFSHVLSTLTELDSLDAIIVDTDSDEILELARQTTPSGVILSKRPAALGTNQTSMVDVLKRVVEIHDADWVLQTHSTSPFLQSETLDRAMRRVIGEDWDSGFGVSRLRARLWDTSGAPLNHDPNSLEPTQDLAPILVENSTFYLFKPEQLSLLGTRFGKNPLFFETPLIESIDIDDEEDFRHAELIWKGLAD